MNTKAYKVGYTTGVFDLFHVGHLNILRSAKQLCEYLIVGVTTDSLTYEMKGRAPIIPFDERKEIVESIKYVDRVIAKVDHSTLKVWKSLQYEVLFKGDDWRDTERGMRLERELREVGAVVHYFPYTKHTSSSIIRRIVAGYRLADGHSEA